MGTILSVSPAQRSRKIHNLEMSTQIKYGTLPSKSTSSKAKNGLKKAPLFFSSFNLKKLSGGKSSRRNSFGKSLSVNFTSKGDQSTTALEKSVSCFTISNDQRNNKTLSTIQESPKYKHTVDVKQHGAVYCRGKASISLLKKSDTFPANLQEIRNSSTGTTKKTIFQTSTSELLKCTGEFLCQRCKKISKLKVSTVGNWFRMIDRSLLYQGWHDIGFINPVNIVFVYLLLRELIDESIETEEELQAFVMSCLYLSYSYMGHEISYPVKPFLMEEDKGSFWNRCVYIINNMSEKMLRMNADPLYFTMVVTELQSYSQDHSINLADILPVT